MTREIHYIVDLQFGSTGKGLLAGYLAEKNRPDTIVTAWGPNAGHTYIDARDNKYVNIMLPNGIVSPELKRILIGPGAVIDVDRFLYEVREYAHLLEGVDIIIHPHAAVVTPDHRKAEGEYGFRIGSTMKGVGEAVMHKIRRQTLGGNVAKDMLTTPSMGVYLCSSHQEYLAAFAEGKIIHVEGAQGYSLGINSGFYPYTTSRECTVQQLMVDCAIPFDWELEREVHGVCRTFPIRVANRYAEGIQIGTSGPCYLDQKEIEWKDIGREPELTTVTKLPRRIFTFSPKQVQEACFVNGVDDVFLNFANYRTAMGLNSDELIEAIETDGGPVVRWLGHGPQSNDIEER